MFLVGWAFINVNSLPMANEMCKDLMLANFIVFDGIMTVTLIVETGWLMGHVS